jgi:ATP-binding cassette subfamily B (MDR/TAP) protein 1
MTPFESQKDGRSSKRQTMLNPLQLLNSNGTLKNTGAPYFALFRPLRDAQSRFILCCGVVLATAAGAPLPIIGIIFARIINVFPPTEDEVRQRISQLLGVGEFYLPNFSALANVVSNCVFIDHVGMGVMLGDCWCSNIERLTYSNGR